MDKLEQVQLLVNALEELKVEAEERAAVDATYRHWDSGVAAGYGNVIRQLEKILDG